MNGDSSKKHRSRDRAIAPSLYDHAVFTRWLTEPFTLSLRWAHQVISRRHSSIAQLTPAALTELFQANQHAHLPCVQFSPQIEKMSAERYHREVCDHSRVYLKNGSNHDLLNALMWISLPLTRALTFRQMSWAKTLRDPHIPQKRSRLEDRLTLFDESGVVILSDREELLQLVRQRDWITLFWHKRDEVLAHLEIWVTGHGLLEQLITPFVGLVGYGRLYRLSADEWSLSGGERQRLVDRKITEDLDQTFRRAVLELHAIPILGYPLWCEANNTRTFYDNARYFRGPYTSPRD